MTRPVPASIPLACTLDPAGLQARREGLLAQLLERGLSRQRLDSGYRFLFDPDDDLLPLIARVVDAERRCCTFLRFQITVEPAGGPVALDLTGPAGTHEFLAAILGV